MDENRNIAKNFADVETNKEHKGCFHSVGDVLTTVVQVPCAAWKTSARSLEIILVLR